jgi:DNA-binding NarL/FixJ family response regulator
MWGRRVPIVQEQIRQEGSPAAYREGLNLGFEEVVALVLAALEDVSQTLPSPTTAGKERAPENPLSEREQEVLGLMAAGHSDKEIAQELCIAERTVRYHLTSIFNKLGADNRPQAVLLAARRGLL